MINRGNVLIKTDNNTFYINCSSGTTAVERKRFVVNLSHGMLNLRKYKIIHTPP